MTPHARSTLRRFAADRRGVMAVLFGVVLIPIAIALGVAIDYSRAANVKAQLMSAADAAVVGALSMSSKTTSDALAMSGDGEVKTGSDMAEALFRQNLSEYGDLAYVIDAVAVTKAGHTLTARLKATAQVPTTFLALAGFSTTTVIGEADATSDIITYVDFYLLLDNTPSMGLGATTADIDKMVANTSDKCAFACHDLANTNNYYNLAKSLGVTMRVDVLREASQEMVTTAKSARFYANQYRMAVYSFGNTALTAGLTAVAPLSTDLDTVKTKAGNLDLMTVQGQNQNNDQDTHFTSVLTQMNSLIPNGGMGSSTSDPIRYLFLVSDGVADEYNPSGCGEPTTSSGRCQMPIPAQLCTALKARNVRIAVLYTAYLPLPTNWWYNTWIDPFYDDIGTRMKDCASPGFYWEVTPGGGIAEAMKAMFYKAISEPRITS